MTTTYRTVVADAWGEVEDRGSRFLCRIARTGTEEEARAVIAAMGKGEIAYRDFPEVLKGKYQNYTQADRTHLEEAGYDQGFHKMEDAVKEYVDFLDNGGYFTYGE